MEKARDRLIYHAKHITNEGGKLIIPSFAIGRTQTLVYYLKEIFDKDVTDDIEHSNKLLESVKICSILSRLP